MPEVVRRKLPGPAVSTGRGLTASADRRTNVRWSVAEDEHGKRCAREAGMTHAEHVREVYLRGIAFEAPTVAKPRVDAPWLVPEPGDDTTPEGVAPQSAEDAPDDSQDAEPISEPRPVPKPAKRAPAKPKRQPQAQAAPKAPKASSTPVRLSPGAEDASRGEAPPQQVGTPSLVTLAKGFLRGLLK